MPHPIMIAARLTVRDAGGAAKVAEHLGKSGHTLTKELDPNFVGGKLGLLDALTIVQATRDLRILQAFADECGCAVMPLPQLAGEVDDDTMRHVGTLVTEFGDVLRDVGAATADGRVTDNEMERVQRQALELQAALMRLLSHVARMNERTRPAPLRAVAA